MKMRKIKTEGTEFFIALYKDHKLTEFPLIADNPEQLKLTEIYNNDDVRLILFQSPFKTGHGILYWLYFEDPTLTENLDKKILDDSFNDNDFKRSVKTFYQVTECSNCQRKFHTLIIPPGDPYPGNPTLLQEKINHFSEFLRCPSCNSRLRQMVVKIIGEVQ